MPYNEDGQHAAVEMVTAGRSPKMVWAGVWALVLSVAVPAGAQLVELLLSQPELFDGLHPVLAYGIHGALVAAGTALAAFRARPGVVVPADTPRHL